jgi:cysteine desulfurase/selenocysteine lyase
MTIDATGIPDEISELSWVRDEFPALVAEPRVAYLDSASTTQKPQQVIETVAACLTERFASPGRGSYPWATRLATAVEQVRSQVAGFVDAARPEEIVFTSSATAAMNAVALSWGLRNLTDRDEILYSPQDHASTISPWLTLQATLARFGVRIRLVPYPLTSTGEADLDAIRAALGPVTRMILVSHVHGLYGARTTLEELRGELAPRILLCFDCTQSAGHIPVAVRELGADFAVLSGHKMFGVPGVGMLYCARRTHSQLGPFLPGGSAGADAVAMPARLEGGSLDAPAVLALGSAIDFLGRVGLERIAARDTALTQRLVVGLNAVPELEFLPGVAAASCPVGYGIVSFRLPGVRANDAGFVFAASDIYVRAGGHCVEGGDAAAIRISLHAYTSAEEIDRAIAVVGALAREGA